MGKGQKGRRHNAFIARNPRHAAMNMSGQYQFRFPRRIVRKKLRIMSEQYLI